MRQSMMKSTAIIAISSVALTGCISLTPDSVYPLGSTQSIDPSFLAAADAPVETTIKTVKAGEILLQQAVSNTVELVLENDVVADGDIDLAVAKRSIDLNAGDRFYPALNVGSETALVACSYDQVAEWIPRLNPGAAGNVPICFRLKTYEDKVNLDTVTEDLDDAESSVFFFVTGQSFGLNGTANSYQKLVRWDQQLTYRVTEPARFALAEPAADDAATQPAVALRFVQTSDTAQLEPVYVIDGQPADLSSEPIVIAPDETFPQTVRHDGAEIELLALNDGVLAYRIMSGFSDDSTFVMDLVQ